MVDFSVVSHRVSAVLPAFVLATLGLLAGPVQAGPMQCTTTLEAPILGVQGSGGSVLPPSAPVEVTRCASVETVPELFERRAYTWTAPYAPGVSLAHQVSDLLGIAVSGDSGRRVIGLGFPDQTLVWDATAIANTYETQLGAMAQPMPWRTADLGSVFTSSLGSGTSSTRSPSPTAAAAGGGNWNGGVVRGLW
ncbi:MAG: Occludin/ELL family protein [Synechococcus sp.]|nr:Occludin/ELL family protein [Synechococcus sp.]